MAINLRTFLDSHRCDKASTDWNLTGMVKNQDQGKYKIADEEYDTFLELVYNHVFGRTPRASSLLEKHREIGPILVDLDMRYELGKSALKRRFNKNHICDFITEYVSAMIYFSKVELLTNDLYFYHLEKPGPETDKNNQKDGVHIQCPNITTTPKYQYGIRGYLLQKDIIGRVFEGTEQINIPEDCYDVAVIHRNNWFLYGACKPDKPQYRVVKVWKIAISDVCEILDGNDPDTFEDLKESVKSILCESEIPTESLDLIKELSIRRNHTVLTPLDIRPVRASEWEELMINWGSGKAKLERPLPVRNTVELMECEDGEEADAKLVVVEEDGCRVTNPNTPEDIALAYRLCRECLNAERRAGEYQDWINVAICLKNISNTEESFKTWVDITHSVDPSHKKAKISESELRKKWNLVRIDSTKRLGMGSLQHWAREDNPEKHRAIMSESHTQWIVHYGKLTHVNVASFVCRIYKHEFRCSLGSRKGSYEWYQYITGCHAWKHMRTATELRARLSGQVLAEYWTAEKIVGDRFHTAKDDDRDRWDKKKKQLSDIQKSLETTSFKDNVLRECQEKFYDDEFLNRLNTNPYLLGVANGVLELRHYDNETMTGRPCVFRRDGLPDDNISFQMGRSDPDLEPIPWIPYDPESTEQKELMAFFERIYPDPVLREYVLTLLSSCLEGTNKEQKFYVMQGIGSNGKSMIEMLMELTFGDYGTSMSTTVFTRKRPDSGAANPDIMTIKCRRYLHMGEPDDNEKINTSIMKQYSGGDRVPARGLFSDQEKFTIMGKIFMSCNDLPPVSKMDNGTWRRIRVIPHVSVFKDPGDPTIDASKNIYEKDLDLENKLRHWRTAFLSLLVHYYDHYYLVHGLKEPACVSSASNKYKEENDLFMSFFNDNFVQESGAGPVSAKEIKFAFQEWRKPLGKTCDLKIHQVMDRMKNMCSKGTTEKEFWGIRVIADETEDLSGSRIVPE